MTDKELLDLKELAQKAKPFLDGPRLTWEEMSQEERDRAGFNQDFFVTAHSVILALIDELIALRQKVTK